MEDLSVQLSFVHSSVMAIPIFYSEPELNSTCSMSRAVNDFFANERPEFAFLAAAKVGGILANNNCPADFIRDNLILQSNLIEACRIHDVERTLFLGSSCIYPKL